MSIEMDLKPCPFCGGDEFCIDDIGGKDISQFVVSCDNCGAESNEMCARAEAIAAWNTRAPSEANAIQTYEDALEYFAKFGNVSRYLDELKRIKPTTTQIHDAVDYAIRNGADAGAIYKSVWIVTRSLVAAPSAQEVELERRLHYAKDFILHAWECGTEQEYVDAKLAELSAPLPSDGKHLRGCGPVSIGGE